MNKHLDITVRGRVQGVGFRAFVKHVAEKLAIKGTVKNQDDGSVFIEAEGDESQLNLLIEKCKSGPPLSSVKKVNVAEGAGLAHSRFVIVH